MQKLRLCPDLPVSSVQNHIHQIVYVLYCNCAFQVARPDPHTWARLTFPFLTLHSKSTVSPVGPFGPSLHERQFSPVARRS